MGHSEPGGAVASSGPRHSDPNQLGAVGATAGLQNTAACSRKRSLNGVPSSYRDRFIQDISSRLVRLTSSAQARSLDARIPCSLDGPTDTMFRPVAARTPRRIVGAVLALLAAALGGIWIYASVRFITTGDTTKWAPIHRRRVHRPVTRSGSPGCRTAAHPGLLRQSPATLPRRGARQRLDRPLPRQLHRGVRRGEHVGVADGVSDQPER
jgi:hypothetical protein